jgi:hypothetical protein
MRVAPGSNIPFWLKLWNERSDRYVRAYLSNTAGVPQSGSPFTLTYSGARGIYTGSGPVMGLNILVSDYQVYKDSGFTQLDNSYLPASDWVEPDVSSGGTTVTYLTPPMIGKIVPTLIKAEVLTPLDAYANINRDKMNGTVIAPKLLGTISTPEIEETL